MKIQCSKERQVMAVVVKSTDLVNEIQLVINMSKILQHSTI